MNRQVDRSLDLPLVLRSHRDEIASAWAEMIPGTPGAHPSGPPPAESVNVIKKALDAIAESLSATSYSPLETFLNDSEVIRVAMKYDIEVVIESLLLIKQVVLPFIAGSTPASSVPYQALTLEDCLHYIIRRFGRLYAGLARQLQEQQRRTALLLRTMQLASSSLELDVVMSRVAEAMAEAVRVPYCGMYLLDAERGVLVTKVAARDSGDCQPVTVHPRRSGLASVPAVLKALEGKRFIVIGAPQLNSFFDQAVIAELRLTLALVAPIQVGERVLGYAVLGAAAEADHTFTSEEIDLATGMANAVALAIDNVHLYEQTRRRLDESQSLQRVTTALLQKLDLTDVLAIVCGAAQRLTGAPGSVLLLLEDNDWLYPAHITGFPPRPFERVPVARSFSGRAVREGKAVFTNNAAGQIWPLPTSIAVTAILAAPLLVRGSVIGVLDAINKPEGFTAEDERIISLFADQAAIAIENARLRQQEEQLAVLEERQRLSRELHDSVTQALYSVTLFADAANRLLATGNSAGAADHVQQLRRIAQDALGEMRLLIFELRPLDLEKQGLIGALKARLAAVENRAGLSVEFQVEGEKRLPVHIEDVLYRVAQEALNNVLKHAQARCATIRLQLGEARVRLEVADDGIGFDLAARAAGGLGLGGMCERVQRIGGTLEVESAPGRGTQVRVEVSVS